MKNKYCMREKKLDLRIYLVRMKECSAEQVSYYPTI